MFQELQVKKRIKLIWIYYNKKNASFSQCPGFKLDSDGKPDPNITVAFAEEARYFVESRLLQRDVEIVLESVNNTNFVGSILFPKGNIAEALLREGFAKCVDWSMAFMRTGKHLTNSKSFLNYKLYQHYYTNTCNVLP